MRIDARANALKRLNVLKKEIDEIETFLRLYDKYAEGQIDVGPGEIEAAEPSAEHVAASPSRPNRPSVRHDVLRPAEIVKHCLRFILDAGRPLTRGELLARLDAEGLKISATTSRGTYVGTVVWRSKKFHSVGDGYWPKGVPRLVPKEQDATTEAPSGAVVADPAGMPTLLQ